MYIQYLPLWCIGKLKALPFFLVLNFSSFHSPPPDKIFEAVNSLTCLSIREFYSILYIVFITYKRVINKQINKTK